MRRLEISELSPDTGAALREQGDILEFVLSATRHLYRREREIAWHAYVVPRDMQKGVVLVTVEGMDKPPRGFVAHQEHSAWLEAGVRQIVIALEAQAIYSVSENWVTDNMAYSAQHKRLVEQDPKRREAVMVQQECVGEKPCAWIAAIERSKGRPRLLEWRPGDAPPLGRLTGFLSARNASERSDFDAIQDARFRRDKGVS